MVTAVIKPRREGQGERMKTSVLWGTKPQKSSWSLLGPLKCRMLIGSWIIAKNGFLLIAFHFSVCLFLPAAQQEQAFKSQRRAFVEWRWRMGEWSINARRRCWCEQICKYKKACGLSYIVFVWSPRTLHVRRRCSHMCAKKAHSSLWLQVLGVSLPSVYYELCFLEASIIVTKRVSEHYHLTNEIGKYIRKLRNKRNHMPLWQSKLNKIFFLIQHYPYGQWAGTVSVQKNQRSGKL